MKKFNNLSYCIIFIYSYLLLMTQVCYAENLVINGQTFNDQKIQIQADFQQYINPNTIAVYRNFDQEQSLERNSTAFKQLGTNPIFTILDSYIQDSDRAKKLGWNITDLNTILGETEDFMISVSNNYNIYIIAKYKHKFTANNIFNDLFEVFSSKHSEAKTKRYKNTKSFHIEKLHTPFKRKKSLIGLLLSSLSKKKDSKLGLSAITQNEYIVISYGLSSNMKDMFFFLFHHKQNNRYNKALSSIGKLHSSTMFIDLHKFISFSSFIPRTTRKSFFSPKRLVDNSVYLYKDADFAKAYLWFDKDDLKKVLQVYFEKKYKNIKFQKIERLFDNFFNSKTKLKESQFDAKVLKHFYSDTVFALSFNLSLISKINDLTNKFKEVAAKDIGSINRFSTLTNKLVEKLNLNGKLSLLIHHSEDDNKFKYSLIFKSSRSSLNKLVSVINHTLNKNPNNQTTSFKKGDAGVSILKTEFSTIYAANIDEVSYLTTSYDNIKSFIGGAETSKEPINNELRLGIQKQESFISTYLNTNKFFELSSSSSLFSKLKPLIDQYKKNQSVIAIKDEFYALSSPEEGLIILTSIIPGRK